MFRNLRLACVIAAITVSSLLTSPVSSEVHHYRAQGDSAHSSFLDIDSTGCIWTYADLTATEGRIRNEPGLGPPSTSVNLFIYQFDACEGHFLTEHALHTSTLIPAEAFSISGALHSASLQVTVDVENRWTRTTQPVTIDVTWTGDGYIDRGHSNTQSTFPGGRQIWRSVGSFRSATPAGSITLQSMTLTGAGYAYGRMESGQSASTTVLQDLPN